MTIGAMPNDNSDLGSLATATPPSRRYFNRFEHQEPRRKGTDFPDDYECARLIRKGVVVAQGLAAVNSFAALRKKRILKDIMEGFADGSC